MTRGSYGPLVMEFSRTCELGSNMFSIISYDKVHSMAHMIQVRSDKPMDWSKGKVCDNPKKDVHKMEA